MAAITTDAGMSVTFPPTSIKGDIGESIEWDLPSYDNFDGEFPDFSNLSLGTEMRNKMWESNNKLTSFQGMGGMSPIHSLSSPLEHNQNISLDSMEYLNGGGTRPLISTKSTHQSVTNVTDNEMFSGGVKYMKITNGNVSPAGTGGPTNGLHHMSMKTHPHNQPLLLRSPSVPMASDRQTPELLPPPQENGYSPLDPRRVSYVLLKLFISLQEIFPVLHSLYLYVEF